MPPDYEVSTSCSQLAAIILPSARKVRDVFRGDTFTARMLRELAELGEWRQADFMRRYHVVCARANPSKSAFGNNFGRFDIDLARWRAYRTSKAKSLGCIRKVSAGSRVVLHWAWVAPDKIAKHLSSEKLHGAEALFERLTIQATNDRDEAHAHLWRTRLRSEMDRRVEERL